MKLFIGLLGFIMKRKEIILALHLDFTIGLLITFLGVFMFWSMLPSTDQNERLRRYDKI
jgi:hypothetical protein